MARASRVQEIEVAPEADRLEGFPHPRETRQLFGHVAAERELAAALGSGRIHHAWLIAGPEGIGKATLAYRFAAYALPSRKPVVLSVSLGCRKTLRRFAWCGPCHILGFWSSAPWDPKNKRFATNIPVDEVRKLRAFWPTPLAGRPGVAAALSALSSSTKPTSSTSPPPMPC